MQEPYKKNILETNRANGCTTLKGAIKPGHRNVTSKPENRNSFQKEHDFQ